MAKKIISLLLAVVLLFGLAAFARADEPGNYLAEAQQLKLIGVFRGTGSGFELTREPTRIEGLIMLIRLLGVEAQAQAMAEEPCAFRDVPDYGRGYVNYAYASGLTKGIGGNLFGSLDKINALSYTTFLLRALGYSDDQGDFTYFGAIDYARAIGLLSAADVWELESDAFLRDHVARTSMLALGCAIKSGGATLLEKLVALGAIPADVAVQVTPEDFAALEVSFIDVGQADAILIVKGPHAMLIDGGNAADAGTVTAFLRARNIASLDYVVATHPHEDHIGGLAAVLDGFEVENIIMPDAVTTTQAYRNLLNAVSREGLAVTDPVCGAGFALGGASFTVLAPGAASYGELNNYSVVIKLTNGGNAFLFAGDAESLSESEMLAKNSAVLKADVLKVGHHGSGSSTSQAFLDAVDPDYAVISVGADNDYGHPDPVVLARLGAAGAEVFRTDKQGTVTASSNGHSLVFDCAPISAGPEPAPTNQVIISSVDKKGELVTLKNTGTAGVNLAGWRLVSVTGNQSYIFPAYTLAAGATVTVASGGASGDLIWTTANIWNNSESDPAELYDAAGNLVYTYGD